MINSTPNVATQHWAASFIGLPWVQLAEGPTAFDCWGIVTFVEREHYGHALPKFGELKGDIAQMRVLARHSGWHRVEDRKDGDVMFMTSRAGPHVGVLVEADGQLGLLHAMGYRDGEGRDHGSVVFSPLPSLPSLGYGRFETWRHV